MRSRSAASKVKSTVELPEGYSIEFGGQFKHLREVRARLAVVVPATLALIFVLVFLSLGSVRHWKDRVVAELETRNAA